jgi:hypothetical protein
MSVRSDVLLWAQRVINRKGSPPHVLLEISEQSTAEQVQDAFHKIARSAHPDLHRNGLEVDELELVTSAYAAVAGAYQQMRVAVARTRPARPEDPSKLGATPPDSKPVRSAPRSAPQRAVQVVSSTEVGPRPRHPSSDPPTTRRPSSEPGQPRTRAATDSGSPVNAPSHVPATPSGAAPSANAAQAMSSKALLYYRKAELCLKRGDLKGAILQLKLACAADPSSGFLRTALAEVETEVRKAP